MKETAWIWSVTDELTEVPLEHLYLTMQTYKERFSDEQLRELKAGLEHETHRRSEGETKDEILMRQRQECIVHGRLKEGECYKVNRSGSVVRIVKLGERFIDVEFLHNGKAFPDCLTYGNYFTPHSETKERR